MSWLKDKKLQVCVSISALCTSAASICCLMSEGSTPGSSSSLTMSWESLSVLSSAATSAQNFPDRSKTSFSFPSLSSARWRISSHRERRRRRRERTAGKRRGHQLQHDGREKKRWAQKWANWEIPFGLFLPLPSNLILKILSSVMIRRPLFVYFHLEFPLSSLHSHYLCTAKSFISTKRAEQKDRAQHRRL